MGDEVGRDRLSGKKRVEMVLTLLIGRDDRVIHGQIFDPGGRRPLAFTDLGSLGNAVQRWLDSAPADQAAGATYDTLHRNGKRDGEEAMRPDLDVVPRVDPIGKATHHDGDHDSGA